MDMLGFTDSHTIPEGLHLSYNLQAAQAHLSVDKPTHLAQQEGWRTYDKIFFEHSDTCPSRQFRQRSDKGLECGPMATPVKMAVCCYVMDKDKNLMLTKRPEHLKIFPNVWVLPGGIVEP